MFLIFNGVNKSNRFQPQYFLDYRIFYAKNHSIPAEKEKLYTYSGCRTGINFLCLLNLSFVFQTFAPPITLIFIIYWHARKFVRGTASHFQIAGRKVKLRIYFLNIFIYYAQRCLRLMFEIKQWGTRKAAFVDVSDRQ